VPTAATESTSDEGVERVYVVLAHDQPGHLSRLVRRLAAPDAGFVVHIDGHVDAQPFTEALAGVPNVVFVEPRVRVRWAAFSQVGSTLRALEAGLERWGLRPTHFIVLSGADYPVKSNEYIREHFRTRSGQQFVRRFDIVDSGDRRQLRRIRARHFRQLADRRTFARKPLFVVEYVLRAFPRRLPAGVRFTSGSNWIAVTSEFAAWCVASARDERSFTRLFHGMFGPDEIYFHTQLDRSPYRDSAPAVEPYYDVTALGGPWRYGNVHYLHPIVAITDVSTAQAAAEDPEVLFARKFDERLSVEALRHLDSSTTRVE
jgi:hypothetical protein